ncbi:MAG: hypothetical protein J6Z11_02685, partial [Candidatus Riflebacteria bacterium]|nr:hypothetical protein [Candidatus Riflebacteria bacterium]
IIFLMIICSSNLVAHRPPTPPPRPTNPTNHYPQQHPNQPNHQPHQHIPQQPQPPLPPTPPPPPPPIRQDFNTNSMYMNLGELPKNGINLTAESGAMAEGSSIEIKQLDRGAASSEIFTNCKSNRFIPVGDLYEIKTTGMNQYAGLPIKYVLMAKGNVPNDSRLFMLAKLGEDTYFIPAKSTLNYGMVIGEVNSCAIYDKVALIADTTYSRNYVKSFMLSCALNSQNQPSNPYYATLSDNDGFAVSAHIFPLTRKTSSFTSQTLTIIQPQTSVSINLYKNLDQEKVFIQSLPFTPAGNYSFCKVDLSNFEHYYDNSSISYVTWIGFENTNIEDIPNALIFRATCYDEEGICYSTEDQLVYIAFPEDNYNSPFSGGKGTSSNPYIITSVKQLDKVRDYKRRFFRLGCDLDLRTYQDGNWLALGDNEEPFNGLFDGNSKTIRNLSINEPNEHYQGLFGCIRNGSVKNLKIELAPSGIICDSYAGAFAGYCSNARLFQCYSSGVIKANNYIGGLIGYSDNYTSVRKCISDFSTNTNIANTTIGGLIGYAEDTTITDCHTNTSILSSGNDSSVGGLVAQGERIKIQNCYSVGNIKTGKTGYAGGLVGYMNNCETKGCIALNSRIEGENQGRLAGKTKSSSFIRCYAWEFIRDSRNKYLSEGGFGGNEGSKEGRNGESISKGSFYGSNTRNKFWTVNKKVGFNLSSWVFNSGYNLPQLRSMPSIANPDYFR